MAKHAWTFIRGALLLLFVFYAPAAWAECPGGGENCPQCGDGTCGWGETLQTCAADCAVCGDGTCTAAGGEDESSCSLDCTACEPTVTCGDRCGVIPDDGCGRELHCRACEIDCTDGFCGEDEVGVCVQDCGYCGDGTCRDDRGETLENCSLDCGCEIAACTADHCGPGVDDGCGGTMDCPACDCAPGTPLFSASTTATNTNLEVLFTADPATVDTSAPVSWDFGNGSAPVTGNPVGFAYAQAGTYGVTMTGKDLACGFSRTSDPLAVTVTSPECGDGVCFGENNHTCAEDCPLTCGDQTCSPGEENACPLDCACNTERCAAGCALQPTFSVSSLTPVPGEPVTFIADAAALAAGVTRVNWDFGDGQHCEQCGLAETHAYARPGAYEVRLTGTESVCGTAQVSRPKRLVVGNPIVGDSSQIATGFIPECLKPGERAQVAVTVRNMGTTTWTAAAGYRLSAVNDDDPLAVAIRVDLPPDVSVPPFAAYTFVIELQAPAEGRALTSWQMIREGVHRFGARALGIVEVREDCGGGPVGPAGTFGCDITVRDRVGVGVAGVGVSIDAFAFEPGKPGKLVGTQAGSTGAGGEAHLNVSPGQPVQLLVCRIHDIRTDPPPVAVVSHPTALPSQRLALAVTLIPDFSDRVTLPGLKPGAASARLYVNGPYDKPVVIPTPFDPGEQTENRFTDERLRFLFEPFIKGARDRGYDLWIMRTKSGQNYHEQAAEAAQLIAHAADALGLVNGKTSVAGYSGGGLTARLATARYEADPAWVRSLDIRPDLPVDAIVFGDAPLVGANINVQLQAALWRDFPRGEKAWTQGNLNTCGAQALLREAYSDTADPDVSRNFRNFFERGVGHPVRFGVNRTNDFLPTRDGCDRLDGTDCVCDDGPAVLTVNGDGFAHGPRLFAFSDGEPGPSVCYGDSRDFTRNFVSICLLMPGPKPRSPEVGELVWETKIPGPGGRKIFATAADVAGGSRFATQIAREECGPGPLFWLCGSLEQSFGPTFIPFTSAIPPGAPFEEAIPNDFHGVHGTGYRKTVDFTFEKLDQVRGAARPAQATHTPVVDPDGSRPVAVTLSAAVQVTSVQVARRSEAADLPPDLANPSGAFYEVSTVPAGVVLEGNDRAEVCITYPGGGTYADERRVVLMQKDPRVGWIDISSAWDPAADTICGGTRMVSSLYGVFERKNRPPVARATYVAEAGTGLLAAVRVTFNGAGSHDPDGDALRFRWTDGSGNVLGTHAVEELVLPDVPEQVRLEVSDDRGARTAVEAALEGQDVTPPAIVSFTTKGAPIVKLIVEVEDPGEVAFVRFWLDGEPMGKRISTPPFETTWDSTTVPNGGYELRAAVYDHAGNEALSAPVSITVDNGEGLVW